jgi:hypothetical protein
MARRRRSFFFDNINKRLLTDTTKNTKDSKDDVDSNSSANTDFMKQSDVNRLISTKNLSALNNVNVTSVADDQVLQYNSSTSKWENATLSVSSSLSGLTDTAFSSLTNNDYLVYNAANTTWINKRLDLSSYVTDTDIAAYSNTAQMNTAIASSNTAMKNYVDAEVAGVVNSAPATLDTLNELAAALGDDPNFATTTSTSLGNRLRIDVSNQSLTSTQKTNALTNLGITATVAELNYVDGVTSNIQTQLDAKGTSSFSGSYNDLSNKPTIPTNNNQLTNGAGYTTTTAQELSRTLITSSDDLGSGTSTPLDHGWYSWGSSQPSNSPDNFALMWQLNDGGQPQQWVMAYGGSANSVDLYARRKTSGTWDTTWTKFWNSTDFSSTNVSNWNTAYGWGNHASAGYSTFSGSYNDLTNKPTIPTNNNQLTNGAGYTTFTANQSLDTGSNVTHAKIIATNWLRNDGAGEGIYNESTGQHFYSAGSSYWHINSGNGLIFYSAYNSTQGNATNRKGYVYFDNSGFGLLHSGGGWAVRTVSGTTELYGNVTLNSISEAPSEWNPVLLEDGGIIKKDSSVSIHGSGYLKAAYLNMSHGASTRSSDTVFFSSTDDYIRKNNKSGMQSSLGIGGGAAYVDVSTSNYGTVKVDDDRGVTWAGYAIRDDWVFMSNGATTAGIYNDTDNEWMLYFTRNGATDFYYNGTSVARTTSVGLDVNSQIVTGSTYLDVKYGASGAGGVRLYDNDGAVQSYWYGAGNGEGGLLDNDGSWFCRARTGTSANIFYCNGNNELYVYTSYVRAVGSFRAPLFYDFNNTGYYAHLDSTSDSIRAAGNIVAYYSDERLKDISGNIENALDKVCTLDGFYYRPNEIAQKYGYKDKQHVGLSAQQVQKILPEVIKSAPVDSEYMTVDYASVVPLLVEAIKELKAEIEELKK